MAEKKNSSRKVVFIIIAVVVVFAVVGGFLLYNAGIIGGESCRSLLKQYDAAKAIEDNKNASDAFTKMMELGCEF